MSGARNTTSAECIAVKLRDLSHEVRESALAVFDDHGYVFNEDLEREDFEALSQEPSQSQSSQQAQLRYCRLCPFSTRVRPELEEHLTEVHETCKICKRMYKDERELEEHTAKEHNKTKCGRCGKMVLTSTLERHMEEHQTQAKIANGKKLAKTQTGGKRGKNPYVEFCRQERAAVKSDHPLYTFGQINQELGRRWKALTDDEKRAYRDDQEKEDEDGVGLGGEPREERIRERREEPPQTPETLVDEIFDGEVDDIVFAEERVEMEVIEERRLARERSEERERHQNAQLNGAQGGAIPKMFKCKQCDEEFRFQASLEFHEKDVHGEGSAGQVRRYRLRSNFECSDCSLTFENPQQTLAHIREAHKKKQITLNRSGQLGLNHNVPPQAKKKIVIFKPAGKLWWPGEVVSESAGTVTVQIYNKSRSVKTVSASEVSQFNYEDHIQYLSKTNSEHKAAFKEARTATD